MATGRDEMLKKNQRKTKRKGLMQVLSDYRREEAQKREYKPKNTPNMGKKAAKAKSNTKTAYSGKSLMPSGKKKKTATQVAFSSGSFLKTKPTNTKPSNKPKPSNTKPSNKPQSSNTKPTDKTKTPDRVTRFLGGQTIKQVQAAAAEREKKAKNTPYARQQAELDRLRAAQAKEREKRRSKGGSQWAKNRLKGL